MINDLDFLTSQERNLLVNELNDTYLDINPDNKTIIDLFEDCVRNNPDKVALIYKNERLTYNELNIKVNKLSNYIINQISRGSDDFLVPIIFDRSPFMIITIWAVLKLGYAYVPIAPDHPSERIKHILKDTKPKLLLTDNSNYENIISIVNDNGVVVDVEELFTDGLLDNIDSKNLDRIISVTDPVYVIYTSGTTGNPKGVVITHEGLYNRLIWMKDEYNLNSEDKFLHKTVYIFDVSVWELMLPFLVGAIQIISIDDGERDPNYLINIIKEEKISVIHFVPSMLVAFLQTLNQYENILDELLGSLRYIFSSGEVLGLDVVLKTKKLLKNTSIYNLYGPTEASIDVTCFDCNKGYLETIPIGKPIINTTFYILNKYQQLLPKGAVGELYLGGVGLAREYLNNSELTNEKFIPNPYQTTQQKKIGFNDRLYKTGDLVKLNENNNLEYIDRVDFQVKIRGYRIELPEIENDLTKIKEIKQAVVIYDNNQLIAYYISDSKLKEENIINELGEYLPDYMIPHYYYHLDEIPLNNSGKVDRNKLPEIIIDKNNDYQEPESEDEKKLRFIVSNLLNIDENVISVVDDLFYLGLDSIKAITFSNQINKEYENKVNISVRDVFQYKTIRNLSYNLNKIVNYKLEKVNFINKEDKVLSYNQESLLFIDEVENNNTISYNVPYIRKLKNNLDIESLKKAIFELISRHEILSTIIKSDDGVYYQDKITDKEFIISVNKYDTVDELYRGIYNQVNNIFDLMNDYPLKVNINVCEDFKVLSFVFHHIVTDGFSNNIINNELEKLYIYYHTGGVYPLDDLTTQYLDFAYLQKNELEKKEFPRELAYYVEHLRDYSELALPLDKRRPKYFNYDGDNLSFMIDSEKIKEFLNDRNVSLYNFTLFAYLLLLSRYSNSDDVVVGTEISNRSIPGTEKLIGFFVNTQVIRFIFEDGKSVNELLNDLSGITDAHQINQELPFNYLVNKLKIMTDLSKNPIFQASFTFQNMNDAMYVDSQVFDNNLNIEDYNMLTGDNFSYAKFDLTLTVTENIDNLSFSFNYATSIFKKDTIKHLIKLYENIINIIIDNVDVRINNLDFLSSQEKNLLINELNDTYLNVNPDNKTVVDLFEDCVRNNPNKIALIYKDERLTYNELNIKVNKLSNYIINQISIVSDDFLVPIVFDRSPFMIISILAVLKMGCAYVPIAPDYPSERIKHILKDTEARLLLVDNSNYENIIGIVDNSVVVVDVEGLFVGGLLDDVDFNNLDRIISVNGSVYVIYTSGTTGNPKGVVITHDNLVGLYESCINYMYGFNENDVWVLFHSYNFDFSVWEIFMPLFTSAKLIISEEEIIKDTNLFYEIVAKEKVTVLNQTPLAFYQFIDTHDLKKRKLNLKYIILGGDKLNFENIKKWYQLNNNNCEPLLYNMYGITEITVHATYKKLNKQIIKKKKDKSIIGKPITNTTFYILDDHQQLLPKGAVGELYLGGIGLAREYLNNTELTNEKFIPNPYQTTHRKDLGFDSRLYKTGDLVKLNEDNDLEYMGRSDFQVKIRGYRVELGEIENILTKIKGINQSLVIYNDDLLVVYYTSDSKLVDEDIINELREYLPDYMIPYHYYHLDEIPLNNSGKLDRNKLPEIIIGESDDYQEPKGEDEKKLMVIVSDLLGIDENMVSVVDDLFYLGLDSIKAIQLSNLIRTHMNSYITVRDIFDYKTIRIIVDKIKNKNKQLGIMNETGVLDGDIPLLRIQKHFFNNMGDYRNPNNFNQQFILYLSENIVFSDLIKAINRLVWYHDAFRINFEIKDNGDVRQFYNENLTDKVNLKIIDHVCDKDYLLTEILSAENSFNIHISNKALYKILLIKDFGGCSYLYFTFHHLIVDAVSWRILSQDLKNLYEHIGKETIKVLGEKQTSYRQWVNEINKYQPDNAEKEYYIRLNKEIIDYNIILDLKSNNIDNSPVFISFSENLTWKLLNSVNNVYNTRINDILLSALSLSLSKLTNLSENYVNLETYGREHLKDEINVNNTMGWFTTFKPMKIITSNNDIIKTIISNKEENIRVPDNGFAYEKLFAYDNIPKILFNYLGQISDNKDDLNDFDFISINNKMHDRSDYREIKNSNYIEMNGSIENAKLSFRIEGKVNGISSFAENYKKNLENIVDRLSSMGRSYLTLSDVGNSVSSSLLDDLQKDVEIEAIFKANPLQTGFIYQNLTKNIHDDAYIVSMIGEYNKHIDHRKFKKALLLAIEAFPSLRTCFNWQENNLVQIIYKNLEDINYTYHDITDKDTLKQEEYINRLLDEDRRTSYDLSLPRLFRFYLIKIENMNYKFIFSNHHIILDGWSIPILFSFINKSYQILVYNQTVVVSEDIAYLNAQKYYDENKDETHKYWIDKIESASDDYSFEDIKPFLKDDIKHIDLNNYNYVKNPSEEKLIITNALFKKIVMFSKENSITLSSIILYVFHRILKTYNQDADVTIVGVTLSGRTINVDEIDKSVGLYINTLPVIKIHNDNNTVVNEIKDVQISVNEASDNSNQKLSEINKIKGNKLFNSLFVYENYPVEEDIGDFSIVEALEKLDYPMAIVVFDNNEKLVINIKFDGDLFDNNTIKNILNTMKNILCFIMDNKELKAKNIQLVSIDERNLLVNELNDTYMDVNPDNKTVIDLFEETVNNNSDKVALVYKSESLTYNELNIKVNKLANYILNKKTIINDDFCVHIVFDRSQYMIISILAVLKIGCAYVPISPDYPSERIKHILKDTEANLLLVDGSNYEDVITIVDDSVVVDVEGLFIDGLLADVDSNNLNLSISVNDLVYVIYTSGSMGNPKGVVITHGGLFNTIFFQKISFRTENKKILSFANYTFDAFVSELFMSLTSKSIIYLLDEDIRYDLILLKEYIKKKGINIATLPPMLLNNNILLKLDTLIIAGDKTKKEVIDFYIKNNIKIFNAYGPSEASICATIHQYNVKDVENNIGKPIQNTTFYILDEHQQLLPKGAVGELYLGGVGLAREYLNNPELTDERFISNPYQTDQQKDLGFNSKLYKTGDLVRLNEDNDLEYVGRSDFQVKIRGHRVELGEIENILTKIDGIKQAIVIYSNDLLVTYYTSNKELDEKNIINELGEYLPDYMVPYHYIYLNEIPLNNSGKVDRNKLPDFIIGESDNYQEPESEDEKKLIAIVSKLLNIERSMISVIDNLFYLGLNSIKAITFSNQINKKYKNKVNVSVRDIFKHKTIRSLAYNLNNIVNYKLEKINFINKKNKILSYNQESLLFIDEIEENNTASYNVPYIRKLRNNVDIGSLKKAILELISRHEILSSVIKIDDGVYYQDQIIDKKFIISINEYDTSDELYDDTYNQINTVFNLMNDYPLKANINVYENFKVLSLVFHHIVTDGFSNNIINNELEKLYSYYHNGEDYPLEKLTANYVDFAYLQKNKLEKEEFSKELDYYKEHLKDYSELILPLDKKRPKYFNFKGDNLSFIINGEKIKKFLKDRKISLYNFTLFAYLVLLSKYSNNNDVVVGTEISNRGIPGTEKLIGFFVNTQVIRFIFNNDKNISDLLDELSMITDAHQINQNLPFNYLVDNLKIMKDLSKNPIFQASFVFQNMDDNIVADSQVFDNNLNIENYNIENENNFSYVKFDLNLTVIENIDNLLFSFNYATSLFKKDTIKHLIELYENIINVIIDNANDKINNLDFLSSQERKLLVNELNDTYLDVNLDNKTVVNLFQESVEKDPDNVALVYENVSLTYTELNEHVNKLAKYILNKKLGDGVFVPLVLDRSPFMIISILSVIKAGCAYVPIAPITPVNRIKHILDDIKTDILLVDNSNYEYVNDVVIEFNELNKSDVEIINVKKLFEDNLLEDMGSDNLNTSISVDDLAYVIYTSGSTGNPKGVMIKHIGLYNFLLWIKNEYNINHDDKILQKTNYTFDASIRETILPFVTNATLVIADVGGEKDPNYLINLINKENITIINFVPSMLVVFLQTLKIYKERNNLDKPLKTLNFIFVGGESLNLNTVYEVKRLSKNIKIYNLYGPTEATIAVTSFDCNKDYLENIPIGKPIQNTTFYILDEHQQLLPKGAVGELYLGGEGLAKGYLNNPELTNEKFISNSYQTIEQKKIGFNSRLYRTGDLVRLNEDNDLEYVGRSDFQVKIRGYRVELGEIESILTKVNEINQSVVIYHDGLIVAYYTSDIVLNDEDIISELSEYLPDYMVPYHYYHLDEIPLNNSGKVDRSKLPDLVIGKNDDYQEPEGEDERKLVGIVSDLLGIDVGVVSVVVDLFYLGLDSIKAITLSNQINKEYMGEVNLSVRDIFKLKTIRNLAYNLSSIINYKLEKIKFTNKEDKVLSYNQESLFFIDELKENNTASYNDPYIRKLRNNVDIGSLKKAILELISRHEILSSIIMSDDGVYYQDKIDDKEFVISVNKYDTFDELYDDTYNQINTIFDLMNDYPLKVNINVCDEFKILSLVFHHIVTDGFSNIIINNELEKLYSYYHNGGIYPLDELNAQYVDFAYLQKNELEEKEFPKELAYYVEHLKDYSELTLPLDKKRPKYFNYDGDNLSFTFDSEKIKEFLSDRNVSLYNFTLFAYLLLLSRFSNSDDVVVGTEISNRSIPGTEKLIGFFVNTQVIRFIFDEDKNIIELLSDLSVVTDAHQINQDLPFNYLVDKLKIMKNLSKNPIFQASFVLQSMNDTTFIGSQVFDNNLNINDYNMRKGDNLSYAKFDLSLTVTENIDNLSFSFNYATSLFKKDTIKHLIELYENIINIIINSADDKLNDLDFLNSQERNLLVNELNDTYIDVNPNNKTVIDLFEDCVNNNPDKIALIYKDLSLTYNELNIKVNKLANYILSKTNIVNDCFLIPIVFDKSPFMVINILAVLKLGCAYVPIAPNHPFNRIKHILKDTKAKLLLTDNSNYKNIMNIVNDVLVLNVEELFDNVLLDDIDSNNLKRVIRITDSAYVIYTSGTTGKPKGVVIEHNSLFNLLKSLSNVYDLKIGRESMLFFSNYTFDLSIREIFLPLIISSKLIISYDDAWQDENKFINYLNGNKVTYISCTPSFAKQIDFEKIRSLKRLVLTGEKLDNEIVNKYNNKKFKLINSYGPTEATVDATFKIYLRNTKENNIGKPLFNTFVYILNNNQKLIPKGSIGELYIGGVGLAREYLNNVELTAEKFISNPYQTSKQQKLNINDRLYKTGDLVRLNKDNDLEYIGRKDFQVKIRGYRIELGEIENALLFINEIEQTIVIMNDNDQLIAYYTSDVKLNEKDIINELSEYLPDYMIPRYYYNLDEIPLNNSGKVDRSKLPEIIINESDDYQDPRTELEFKLLEIWSGILKIDENMVSVNDDFFYLGGNSILAITLANKINKAFDKQLTVNLIFENPTIIKQASLLANELRLSAYDEVVEFQRGSENRTRFIFVHPGEGGAESYNKFSKLLNKDIPFYAIDHYNLKHTNKMDSLKDIAKKYIGYLDDKGLIEDNNFVLGGWSSGGVIAFEIAYQLEKMNKKPKKLLIFDSKINVNYNNEKISNENKEYYIKLLEKYGLKEGDEFFEEMFDAILKNNLNERKLYDGYLPSNKIDVDTIYYHAYIDDNLNGVDKKNYTNNEEE